MYMQLKIIKSNYLINRRSIGFKKQAYMYILQDKLHRKTFILFKACIISLCSINSYELQNPI